MDEEKEQKNPAKESDDSRGTGEDATDDINIESEEETPASSFGRAPIDKVKKLKDKLKACHKERQQYLSGWQRAKADFINARKEEEKKRGEFVKFAKEDIITQILPVVDSFELAFANKESWEKVDEGWRKGVEYIYSQLLSILETNGVAQINPLGEAFDPSFHTSVESVPTKQNADDGKVVAVLQKGYVLNGKVVRPAQVRVGSYNKDE